MGYQEKLYYQENWLASESQPLTVAANQSCSEGGSLVMSKAERVVMLQQEAIRVFAADRGLTEFEATNYLLMVGLLSEYGKQYEIATRWYYDYLSEFRHYGSKVKEKAAAELNMMIHLWQNFLEWFDRKDGDNF